MFRLSQSGKVSTIILKENSPLRSLDPRTKLFMSLCGSLTVMLPLEKLILFILFYIVFLTWAKLLDEMLRQVWRLKWILIFLFIIDWWLVSLELAAVITLRLVLLAGVFALFFSTTTADELRLALERLGIPYRYAFSINLAFQSIGLLQEEWNSIREAQFSRGALRGIKKFKDLFRQIGDFVALTVPAIVLTTRRAWSLTEAAYARGFDSPKRISYYQLNMNWRDWFAICVSIMVLITLFWRWNIG